VNDGLKDQAEHYVALVGRVYPGTALRWGYPFFADGLLTAPFLRWVVDELRRIAVSVRPWASEDVEAAMLLRSVRWRLFELDTLLEWRLRPHFYVQKLGVGLIEALAGSMAHGAPALALKASVRAFPDVVGSALHNLSFTRVARLDALCAAHILRRFRSRLRAGGLVRYDGCGPDLDAAAEAALRFERALADRVPASNPLTLPVGPDETRGWIEAHSGIEIDVASLAQHCEAAVAAGREELHEIHGRAGSSRRRLVVSASDVRLAYRRAHSLLNRWFGTSHDLLDSFAVRRAPDGGSGGGWRMAYSSMGYVTGKSRNVVLYRSGAYVDRAQLELDAVHEVYPGHHWERTRFDAEHAGRMGALTHESRPHLEGWPKYCEEFYAKAAGDPEVERRARGERAAVALRALAALRAHAGRRSTHSIVSELTEVTGLSEAVIRSAVIDAYLSPLDHIAPMVGYLAVKRVVRADDARSAHLRLTAIGPRALWGVKL